MDVFDLQAKISLDVTGYLNAIKQVQEQTEKLKTTLSGLKNPLSDNGRSLTQLTDNLKNAQDATKNAQQEVDRLKEELEQSKRATGENSEETRELTERLKDAEKELEKCKDAEKDLTNELEDYARRTDDADRETDDLEDSIRRTGETSEESGRQISGFGDLLLANLASQAITKGIDLIIDGIKRLGQATFGFIKDSVNVSMAFDSSMGQVRATLGGASEDMIEYNGEMMKTIDALDAFAIETGGTTSFSASQAAEGINLWALAGKKGLEIMEAVPISMSLAKAGALDLATATRYLSVSQNALNLTTEETNALVDQMAATASNSGTDIGQLGDALLGIGGNASSLNGGFIQLANGEKLAYDRTTELNAAFGILGDNGTFAGEAGTALRNVLMGLSSDKFETNFTEALGIEAYDEATGKLRPLRDIFLEMNEATKDMSQQQLDDLLGNAFNVRSIKDIRAFLNTDAEKWDRLLSTIQNSEGWATSAGDAITNNLAGSITLFNSAIETAHIKIGRSLTPELRNFVDMGASQITRMTDIFEKDGIAGVVDQLPDIFNQWVDAVTEFASNIAEKFDFSKILTSIAKALTTIIGQIPGIITNVLPQLLNGAIEAADIIVNGIFDTIETLFTADNMTGFFTSILDIIGKLGDFIGKNVGGLIDAAVTIVDALVDSFYSPEVVSKIFETAASLVRSLVDGLTGGDHLQKLLGAALNITLKMQEVFMQPEVVESITEAAAIIMSELAKGIMQMLPQIVTSLAAFCKNIVDYIMNYDWSETGEAFVNGFFNGFDSMDWSFLDDVEQKWVDFWDEFAGYWVGINDQLTEFFNETDTALAQWIVDVVSSIGKIPENIAEFLAESAGYVADFWGGIINDSAVWFGQMLMSFGEFLSGYGKYLSDKFLEMTAGWRGFWENVGASLAENVIKITEKWHTFWSDIAMKTAEKVSEVLNWFQHIPDKLQEIANNALHWGTDLMSNFISGIRSKIAELTRGVSDGVANTVSRFIHFSEPDEGPLKDFHTFAPDMMQLFAKGITDNADLIQNAMQSATDFMDDTAIPGKIKTEIEPIYNPEIEYSANVSGYASDSSYTANRATSETGVSDVLGTCVTLLQGILAATEQGHYISVSDIDTSLGRLQAAEIRRGI